MQKARRSREAVRESGRVGKSERVAEALHIDLFNFLIFVQIKTDGYSAHRKPVFVIIIGRATKRAGFSPLVCFSSPHR